MGRVDADAGHAGAGERAARHRELERERARAADDLALLEGGMHPLVGQGAGEALEQLLARRRVEVLADRADGAAVLVLVGARADVEHDRDATSYSFSSGA